jgi:hypothetical protein
MAPRKRRVAGKTLRSPDDGARGRVGVLASIAVAQDGHLRLVLDDAEQHRGRWRLVGFFTNRDYPTPELDVSDLSRAELEAIGRSVVARILATRSARAR